MKNFQRILTVIFALTIIISCSKDENEVKEPLKKESISAKWLVNGTTDYESFEFNKSGNYIIVKNTSMKSTDNQNILFGTYENIDNTTIVLSDFGTIKISEINEDLISFSIQLVNSPENEIIINASKQAEMENTTKTELLCRTWEMATVNGENVTGTEYELSVLFSQAGTYFVEFANPEEDDDGGLAHWKWQDETETKFQYSWDTPPVWEDDAVVEIIKLNENTLELLERFDGEDDELYVLKPANNTKSTQIMTKTNQTKKKIKTGFLKK
jgi:hypothetical protein